jgi:hypothetical protein
MRKIVSTIILASMIGDVMAWSDPKPEEHIFSSMWDAITFARFKNAADGYGDYKDAEPVYSAETYVIDGIKVIVTDTYMKNKEEYLDRKAKRNRSDPRRMKYMEECISLTQDLNVCKELWNERQK